MVTQLRRLVSLIQWTLVLLLPLLAGFTIVYFSLQHIGLVLNLRPWLIALVVVLVVIAFADARYRKLVTQREEA